MVSISSVDKAFDAIEQIEVGISKCDVKHTMIYIKDAEEYAGKMHYEAGEEVFKTLAVRDRIDELINKFNTECICHKV